MFKNISNKKLILKYNIYLSDCDLINKYLLKSIYSKPVLKKVVLYFSMNNFKAPSRESNLKIKCFLIFYLCFSLLSYINFFKIKSQDVGYSLKVVLSDFNDIHMLLFTLIVENRFKFFKQDFQIRSAEGCNFNYNKLIPLEKFVSDDLNIFGELDVKTSFSFLNFFSFKNKNLVVKNLPLLWVV
jgi:hypothetical protein